jgi:hypothetical protein
MRALPIIALVLSLALSALAATVAAQQPNVAYRVIAHPNNPVVTVERKFLEDAFLKKITRWPNDNVIRPADLPPHSAARIRFSEDVLHRSVAAVKAYWQQRIFSGRGVPPPELDNEDRVVTYVLEHEGAVGYISQAADVRGAKVLAIVR